MTQCLLKTEQFQIINDHGQKLACHVVSNTKYPMFVSESCDDWWILRYDCLVPVKHLQSALSFANDTLTFMKLKLDTDQIIEFVKHKDGKYAISNKTAKVFGKRRYLGPTGNVQTSEHFFKIQYKTEQRCANMTKSFDEQSKSDLSTSEQKERRCNTLNQKSKGDLVRTVSEADDLPE